MPNLTPNQQRAVEAPGPVVVVAGAGSGKTTVLVERYLRELVQQGEPGRILALSFTNEAADQLRSRIVTRLDEQGAGETLREKVKRTPAIGTIHSFCFSVLADFGAARGFAPIREILSTPEYLWEWRNHFEKWLESMDQASLREGLQFFDRREWDGLARQWCQQRWAWERGKTPPPPEEAPIWEWMETEFGRLQDRFRSTTRDRGRYSFADLETLTLDILDNHAPARISLQNRYRALLVDEFQDTSRIQWEILQHLLHPKEKLFVVGDPKQSIYGFRGADVEVFFEVHDSLGAEQTVVLEENFRTGQVLLEKINDVARRLFAQSPFPFHPLVPQLPEAGSWHTHASAPADEGARVADVVTELLEAGAAESDIAILVRVSDTMARLERILGDRQIRTAAVSGGDLQKQREVKTLTAYLRALDDPLDDFHLSAFLCAWGWTQEDLWALREPNRPLFETLQKHPSLTWLVNLVETGEGDWRRALEVLFAQRGPTPPCEARFTFAEALGQASSLADAVDRLDAWESETLPLENLTGRGVRLLTVHGSKGLEFPHVLLPDLNRQSPRNPPPLITDPSHPPGFSFRIEGERAFSSHFETLFERRKKREREESLRVLYVAMTRAKESLHLFLPDNLEKLRKESWANWLTDPEGISDKT